MAEPFQQEPSESISVLVGDLLADAQQLIRQEVALIRTDFQEDFNHHKAALRRLTAAVVASIIGGIWLSLCLVYLLHEAGGFALWQSFGLIGVALLISGRYLLYRKQKTKEFVDGNGKSDGKTRDTKPGNTLIDSP